MFRKITISAVSALVLASGAAFGEGAQTYVHDIDFAHEGVFGKFDKNQLQLRGGNRDHFAGGRV